MFIYIQSSGYNDFYTAICKLIDQNLIIPTQKGRKETNGKTPPLPTKFTIAKELDDLKDIELRIMSLNKKIDVHKYYMKHPKEFIKDEKEIRIISDFLNNPTPDMLTINERSWELFGDEKFLRAPDRQARGEVLLRKLGLTFNDLNAYYAYEPFIFYFNRTFSSKDERIILIVENKDTFWSFHKLLFETENTLDIDMLIYGEGKKIINSFQYVEKLACKYNDTYLYYGDLDREGINIYFRLKESYEKYKIRVFHEMYENLLQTSDVSRLKKSKNAQTLIDGASETFLSEIHLKYRDTIIKIIENDLYIPQEAFNFTKMLERYKRGDNAGIR